MTAVVDKIGCSLSSEFSCREASREGGVERLISETAFGGPSRLGLAPEGGRSSNAIEGSIEVRVRHGFVGDASSGEGAARSRRDLRFAQITNRRDAR